MDNKMMMLLPLLMSMNGSSGNGLNMTDILLNMLKTQNGGNANGVNGNANGVNSNSANNGGFGGLNPMALLVLSMMQNGKKQPDAPEPVKPEKKAEPNFDAIKNLSGNDVAEALKILTALRG